MPKIKCECENIISLSDIPSPNQWMIISDVDYEKYFDTEIDHNKLYMEMQIVVKCKVCGRLYVYWDGFENKPIIYKPEYIPKEYEGKGLGPVTEKD